MYPETKISNGLIHAHIFLPDAESGYYRGTRFDWSGVITSLTCNGHEYFGPWFDVHDPMKHDGIVGPVEEFQSTDGGPGYAAARAGGTFIRIGVGVVRKPIEQEYRRFGTYDIVDPGIWAIRQERDSIEFRHAASDTSGNSYDYRKLISLVKNKPELTIEHWLTNTGRHSIQTTHFNHNFFVMDGEPVGPAFAVRFPFQIQTSGDLKNLAELRANELRFLQEFQKGQSILISLDGFNSSSRDHEIVVENSRTGAGVRIQGDQPLHRIVFWCIRKTLCPEPYIAISLRPGQAKKWTTRYSFRQCS